MRSSHSSIPPTHCDNDMFVAHILKLIIMIIHHQFPNTHLNGTERNDTICSDSVGGLGGGGRTQYPIVHATTAINTAITTRNIKAGLFCSVSLPAAFLDLLLSDVPNSNAPRDNIIHEPCDELTAEIQTLCMFEGY